MESPQQEKDQIHEIDSFSSIAHVMQSPENDSACKLLVKIVVEFEHN